MRHCDGFDVSGAPKTGPLAHDMNCELAGFEDQFMSALTPFWDRPTHSKPASWTVRENRSPFRGIKRRENNINVTSQSVTYVLTQKCYLCPDCTRRTLNVERRTPQ